MPGQSPYSGVMVMVARIGALVPLVAVNAGTSPEPFAGRPILILLFVQVNVVPVIGPEITVKGAASPLQYTWLAMGFTVAAG